MPQDIRFKIDRQKVVEALVFLAEKQPRIDAFHICKVLFYADREHLRKYGRPILGDQYYAMDDGPVPSFALNIVRRQVRHVQREWLDYADRKLSFDDSDGYMRLTAIGNFDDNLFSRTDIECLTSSLQQFGEMDFLRLWKYVHDENEWKSTYAGGGTSTAISFEKFFPEDMPDREKAIQYLKDTASVTEI